MKKIFVFVVVMLLMGAVQVFAATSVNNEVPANFQEIKELNGRCIYVAKYCWMGTEWELQGGKAPGMADPPAGHPVWGKLKELSATPPTKDGTFLYQGFKRKEFPCK